MVAKPSLLSTDNGKDVVTLTNPAVASYMVYSPDGRFIAGFGNYGDYVSPIQIWDASSGKRYLNLYGNKKQNLG